MRDDDQYWTSVETYIRDRSAVEFSHGICPGCTAERFPGLMDDVGATPP